MIPRGFITEWSATVPWPTDEQIEQNKFYGDTKGLLRPDIQYDHNEAWEQVKELLIEKV